LAKYTKESGPPSTQPEQEEIKSGSAWGSSVVMEISKQLLHIPPFQDPFYDESG